MDLYMILRRDGWEDVAELEAAAERSKQAGEGRDDVRWIRTYVLEEPSGRLGTVCFYEGADPEALREHAREADLPADEVVRVVDTLIVNPDPVPEPA